LKTKGVLSVVEVAIEGLASPRCCIKPSEVRYVAGEAGKAVLAGEAVMKASIAGVRNTIGEEVSGALGQTEICWNKEPPLFASWTIDDGGTQGTFFRTRLAYAGWVWIEGAITGSLARKVRPQDIPFRAGGADSWRGTGQTNNRTLDTYPGKVIVVTVYRGTPARRVEHSVVWGFVARKTKVKSIA
jgi:hypothetical protein